MIFSEISKALRKEKGLSQAQLAEALKVSNGCIGMIEIGKNEPTANNIGGLLQWTITKEALWNKF